MIFQIQERIKMKQHSSVIMFPYGRIWLGLVMPRLIEWRT